MKWVFTRSCFALACGAFALSAAVFGAAGCAQMCAWGGKSTSYTAKSTAPAAYAEDDSDEQPQAAAPQNINVFGEVNGKRRGGGFVIDIGLQQHTFPQEGIDSEVCVDPTGKWLVFSSTRNSDHPSIYMQRVDGTAVTQLTASGADDAYPAFSPDGKLIAFSSTRAGAWQIFVMDIDGKNVTQITSGTSQSIHPSFSPDGNRLVFCTLGARSGQWELWTVNLKTTEKRMIGDGLFPTWSPDRTLDRIAFQRARQRGSHWFSVWTMDLVDGEGLRVTEVAVSPSAAIISPAWSPDGRRVAFTTIMQTAHGNNKVKGQTDIWIIDADGANRQRLTDGRGSNLTPFWGADNRVYFISDRGGPECIWSIRADVDRQTNLAKDAPKNQPPQKQNEPAVGSVDTGEVNK
jgi:TolB protein